MIPKTLLKALGLSEDADEASVTAAVIALRDRKEEEFRATPRSVMKLLGADTETRAAARIEELQKLSMSLMAVTGVSTHEQALLQVNAWKAGHDQSVKLGAQVTELEESNRVAKLESTIQQLSIGEDAKLRPAQHDWARANFSSAKSLSQWALSAPSVKQTVVTEIVQQQSTKLTEEERNIARQTGVAEADFLATRNQLNAERAARRAGV